ncbi:F420H2 dehydrogenase subunit F [Sporotomaculum syntrophicum]|jgi:coenzyme F420-reducing hydrogenase beta subunit|uniref:F420H2 dehydrogenase subunit F n=1 Tax=Sporotomaculum syntrophicum TaxID=182264 RepID=A0A9D2WS00_9FIRM|nr:Coenzyme F420 hydrogenase/dehydrogenase, beta subunit C-terminal domain [Sporotomaculum syntrophicum]KAF1086364.1 F420H2 dehydrogenase subunit F [Sporotomaculum syntrophicum]
MMLLYERKEECCGCTACMSICPKKAITMIPDEEGFLYPSINHELCIECDLCKQVCPFSDTYKTSGNYDQPLVYAAKHKDDNVRMNSSSGGMFTAISDYILDIDGVVYGAAFDEKFVVRHQKAETAEERNKFRGSKYVQSNLIGVFEDIKKELKKERTVLFTGTPCQNAGLRSYLNKNYEKLILCDIVCHGTPSPLIFEKFIRYCGHKNRSSIKEYYCRFKGNGWHSHTEKAVYANGKEDSTSLLSQSYKALFYSHVALRPACHNCKFCNFSRPSDITFGDFWGIEKSMPDFDDNIGVSLLLINSSKGQELFQRISKNLCYRKSNTTDCLQHNLHTPSQPSPRRNKFWQDYKNKGFEYVLKKYAGYGLVPRLKKTVVKVIKKIGLLHVVKRVLGRG